MAALVDTNVLVYRFDPRFPEKQRTATDILRRGIREDNVRLPHQAIVEFVAVVTRPLPGGGPLLSPVEVIYPTEALVRTALRGAAAYQLWCDAHLCAYAEHYGLSELFSEDFQHDRLSGTVRVVNPFV